MDNWDTAFDLPAGEATPATALDAASGSCRCMQTGSISPAETQLPRELTALPAGGIGASCGPARRRSIDVSHGPWLRLRDVGALMANITAALAPELGLPVQLRCRAATVAADGEPGQSRDCVEGEVITNGCVFEAGAEPATPRPNVGPDTCNALVHALYGWPGGLRKLAPRRFVPFAEGIADILRFHAVAKAAEGAQ